MAQAVWGRVAELSAGFLTTGDSKPMFKNPMAYSKLQSLFLK